MGAVSGGTFVDGHGYSQLSVGTKEVGSGRGYHGVKRYHGVPFGEVLRRTIGEQVEMDKTAIVTGSDGHHRFFPSVKCS